jgi:hypothetical protein
MAMSKPHAAADQVLDGLHFLLIIFGEEEIAVAFFQEPPRPSGPMEVIIQIAGEIQ